MKWQPPESDIGRKGGSESFSKLNKQNIFLIFEFRIESKELIEQVVTSVWNL